MRALTAGALSRFSAGNVCAADRAFIPLRLVPAAYSPVRDEASKVEGVLCIVSETTERVVAQERQRLLLREANHRLKNLFAMVDAMINLSVRSAQTPKDVAQVLRGRLAALLRAKELAGPGSMAGNTPPRSARP
jgi:hypothetical protein